MRFFLPRRKENGMTKKERARRLTYEALVILGVLVAYAAMFGFDKLKEILNWGQKNENQ